MGLKKVRRLVTKPCFHIGRNGEYCSRCGALIPSPGSFTEYEEVLEACFHSGQFGKFCTECGDKIGFGL